MNVRTNSLSRCALAAAAAVALSSAAIAQGPRGTIKSADLWFDAKASLGPFRGITHAATGQMTGGPALANVRGFVEAASTSLSTDNSIRDHDMRKTLEVGEYPTIRFDLDSVAVLSETTDSAKIELLGRLSIHGVTKKVRLPAQAHLDKSQARVTSSFDLFLPDYKITNLKRMLGALKMQETIRVGLDVTFTILH